MIVNRHKQARLLKKQRHSGQSGFTLIELIVVLVVLAILAAWAMPRFTNIQKDARVAKLNAAKGSVAAASSLIHASVLAKNGQADTIACATSGITANNSGGANGQACTENGPVYLVYAYPDATDFGSGGAASSTPGILAAAGLTTIFNPTKAELNAEGYDYAVVGTTATFSVLGGSGICSFTYQEAVANAAPVISSVNTSGC